MARPTTLVVVVAVVVVLLHALVLAGRAVASIISLVVFVLTHPGFTSTPFLFLSSGVWLVVGLALATGAVLLGLWFWRGRPQARVLLTVLLALSGLLTLVGLVSLLSVAADPGPVLVALSILQVALCVAAVVLLWLAPTSAWLRKLPADR